MSVNHLEQRVTDFENRLSALETVWRLERELEEILARIQTCQNEARLQGLQKQLMNTMDCHQSALVAVMSRDKETTL